MRKIYPKRLKEDHRKSPEENLWWAVIEQAVEDALWKKKVYLFYRAKFWRRGDVITMARWVKVAEKERFYRDEEAYYWLMRDDAKYFNSFLNLSEILGVPYLAIREYINRPREEQVKSVLERRMYSIYRDSWLDKSSMRQFLEMRRKVYRRGKVLYRLRDGFLTEKALEQLKRI